MARIAPDRDLCYRDLCIPAGTPVGMTTILMHTDNTLYPNPLSFNPDRWMDTGKRMKSDKTYTPFSRGARLCVGMQYVHFYCFLVCTDDSWLPLLIRLNYIVLHRPNLILLLRLLLNDLTLNSTVSRLQTLKCQVMSLLLGRKLKPRLNAT